MPMVITIHRFSYKFCMICETQQYLFDCFWLHGLFQGWQRQQSWIARYGLYLILCACTQHMFLGSTSSLAIGPLFTYIYWADMCRYHLVDLMQSSAEPWWFMSLRMTSEKVNLDSLNRFQYVVLLELPFVSKEVYTHYNAHKYLIFLPIMISIVCNL